MTRLLLKLPWFVSASAIVVAAAALAIGANVLVGPYFERSFLDEADPLAGVSGAAGAEPTRGTEPTRAAAPTEPPTARSIETPAPVQQPAAASAPEPTATPSPTGGDGPGVLAQGEWRDGEPGHNGEGIAKIIRTEGGELVLRVEAFSVTNGPDLFVVLSPDAGGYADGSLTLGGLKATDGAFNYEIPDGTDLSRYKSVVVWCRSFDVTFAVATLEAV